MSEITTYPAPVVEWPPPPRNKWERECQAFLKLLPELLNSHRDRYVAVHEGRAVDDDEDLIRLALRVYERHGYVPIYMDLVTERPPPTVRIPHRRVLGHV